MFVVLSSVELNVKRVHERVSRGGHSIPDDVIRRRYGRAFANLPVAIQIAHETVILDNSGTEPLKLVSIVEGELIQNALNVAPVSHVDVVANIHEALERMRQEANSITTVSQG